jgi:agmatine/peptidylarginine deiminase
MSTRGVNFLNQWVADNLDEIGDANETAIAEMVMKLFADAKAIGISEVELEEGNGSAHDVVREAIRGAGDASD